jgi:hypothetical protein
MLRTLLEGNDIMATTQSLQELIEQKLDAFEQLKPEFEDCFIFVQQVHGQKRFDSFPIASTVRYLHSLWVCERKDRLLSIYRNIERYEGGYSLQLLAGWQRGETADVVAFLQRKLDTMPFADLTRQIQEARQMAQGEGLARRLSEGRGVLLNRGFNMMNALDAIFSLSEEQLMREVREACEQYEHLPEQIELQLAQFDSSLYAYVTSQALARRNMEEMNKIAALIMSGPPDRPGARSGRVLAPTIAPPPLAEEVIRGYIDMSSTRHNNLRGLRFVDAQE